MLGYAIGSRRLELATVAERRVRMVDIVNFSRHQLNNMSSFTFRKKHLSCDFPTPSQATGLSFARQVLRNSPSSRN